jgi:hypothetical protein
MRTTLINKIAAREWRILRWIWDGVIILGTAFALAHVVCSLHAMPIT